MQCTLVGARIFAAFLLIGIFGMMLPSFSHAQYAPVWSESADGKIHIVKAMDTVAPATVDPCNPAYNVENCTEARDQFMNMLTSTTDRCQQTFDMETISGSGVINVENYLFSGGSLSWDYDIDPADSGPVNATLQAPAGFDSIRDAVKEGKGPSKNVCGGCASSCTSCRHYMFIYSNHINIEFNPPVGAVSAFFSRLATVGNTIVRLTHTDGVSDSTTDWQVVDGCQMYANDGIFFGAIVTDESRAIKKLQVIPGGETQYCGLDDIFVATLDQVNLSAFTDDKGNPVAEIAMEDPTLYCNGTQVELDGSASRIEGLVPPTENGIEWYTWVYHKYINGVPNDYIDTIGPSSNSNATIENLDAGVYKLELTVEDSYGATAQDTCDLAVGTCTNLPDADCPDSGLLIVPIKVPPSGP